MPKLVVKQGGQTRDFPLAKETVSIGRTPENDIEVKDSLISRRHTSVVKKGDRWFAYDLGSSNGTYVNREKVETRALESGDIIKIGDTEITFLADEPAVLPRETRPRAKGGLDAYGSQQIVQKVDEIAGSFSLNVGGATLAESVGASLRDIRKDPGKDKTAGFFRILFEVGKALSTAATLDDLLQTAVQLVFEVVQGERVVILLKPEGSTELAPRLAYHRARGVVPAAEIPISRTITNQVVTEKVSIITSDALQDPRFMQGLSIVQYNIRSALCVPLWEGQQVYGALYLDNLAKSYAFTKDDLELMTAIANLVAIRIKQEETAARLRKEETLRSNLSKYHSPDVVNMLMTHGGEMGLEVAEREVSVVFIDVVSSTGLAETLTAPQVAALLNEFFLMATNAVFAHKGHVNKFIGDEVMSIFNAPVDMADHALSAVRACAEFLQSLKAFNLQNPDRAFNVRCAVNSGTAVAGNVGTPTRMEYTVIGDTVNVAARLSKFPPINSIVIGERTHELVKGEFKAKDLGESVVKGKEKTLRVYEVILP